MHAVRAVTAPTDDGSGSGDVETVADITNDHQGWMIQVYQPMHTEDGRCLVRPHVTFTLGKGFTRGPSQGCVRQWTRPDGTKWVGLTDDETGPGIVGTEHMYPAGTPCELLRQVTRTRKRRAQSVTFSVTP